MKKLFLAILILISCISVIYSQQSKSKTTKDKKCHVSEKNKADRILSQKSVSRIRDLNILSVISGGDVFIGGYDTEFKENKVEGYGLLWMISNDVITVKKLPFLGAIDDMFWIDNLIGWVSGYGHGVYKTIDGGETWEDLENSDDIRSKVFFLDANLGWYFGKDEYLKRIKDGRVEKLHLFDNFPSVKKLQFTSFQNGWLYDVVNSRPRFQHTQDGGKTWEAVTIDGDPGVGDFQFIDDYEGFAISSEGLYYTNDNGKSWKLVKKDTQNEWFNKLFFLDRNTGWVIGRNSCSTTNAGRNWKCSRFQKELGSKIVRGFAFTDTTTGWLLTDDGLYITRDGGNNWLRKQLFFADIRF